MHEDLTDSNATNPGIKLRDSRADNRRWFLRINDPGRYSEKQLVGVQEIPTPEETAAQAVVRSEERKLFEQVFGPLDPELDAQPEKVLTVDEWLAMRPPNAPEPEPLQLSSGPHGFPAGATPSRLESDDPDPPAPLARETASANALDDPAGTLDLRRYGFRLARQMRDEIAERQNRDGPHGEQTRDRRYATPDDIEQPEHAPQVAMSDVERVKRAEFLRFMDDEDER